MVDCYSTRFSICVVYYFVFRFAINKFNIKTPGRELDGEENQAPTGKAGSSDLATNILDAMGGRENIAHLDACITRLRVSVNDIKDVDKDELKRLGAAGVLEIGNNIQAIFGPRSETIKGQMKDIMEGKKPRMTVKSPEKGVEQQIEEINPEALPSCT